MSFENLIVVAGILQRSDKSILLVKRPQHKPMPLIWELPGGKLEMHETPEQALVREIFEEINLIISPQNLSPFMFLTQELETDKRHMILLAYLCRQWEGTLILKEQQEEYIWVRPHDIHKYILPPADEPIIKRLQECT